MLSRREKEEFIKDGRSLKRRKNFCQTNKLFKKIPSLDEYLRFLMKIQEVFSPFPISKKKTVTARDRL
jgi:hypothetical protein